MSVQELLLKRLLVAMTVGQSIRAGVSTFAIWVLVTGILNLPLSQLVGNIVRKSLRLSGRARGEHSVGQIITMISTDATNIEQFMAFAHT